jgi:DNA-3-methyladenine glycosylase II
MAVAVFTKESLKQLCDRLAAEHAVFHTILQQYGYPPFWSRTASFATLIHIVLEQQVSLASAKAAFLKLQEKIGTVTPEKLLLLTDEEMKACYFSRQKTVYARELAHHVLEKQLVIEELERLPDEWVRRQLTAVKGIGNWTADIFLMMVLHRTDCFPPGDIALITSLREAVAAAPGTTKETLLAVTENWRPYRTIAAFLLWHAYICKRNIRL